MRALVVLLFLPLVVVAQPGFEPYPHSSEFSRSGPDEDADLSKKVSVVNVSPKIIYEAKGASAWQRDPSGHQYYRNNPRVRHDMVQVLQGKLDDIIGPLIVHYQTEALKTVQ